MDITTDESNYLYDLRGVAAVNPAATHETVTDLDETCVRMHGQDVVLREWGMKDSQSILESSVQQSIRRNTIV